MDASSPVYDQNFFLKLARPKADTDEARAAARDKWNAWRRKPENADVAVTFEGVDFRLPENAGISFSGFEFGDGANFCDTTFGDYARFDRAKFDASPNRSILITKPVIRPLNERRGFDGATFGNHAQFGYASFSNGISFVGACFGKFSKFPSATFGPGANFTNASFGQEAIFASALFSGRAKFAWATFDQYPSFARSLWLGESNFVATQFGAGADFSEVTFNGSALFKDAQFLGKANFSSGLIEAWIERERERFGGNDAEGTEQEKSERVAHFLEMQRHEASGPHRFLTIDFSDARILGEVSFAGRSFERPANFTGVRFHQPPDFDGATHLQRLDLTGARVGFVSPDWRLFRFKWPFIYPRWTTDSTVPVRLRAFRKIAEETKNHDLERNLYIEERKAERGVHWRRYVERLRFAPTLKAARVLLHLRRAPPVLSLFGPPESAESKAFRLAHGRSRLTRPAMLAWSSPAWARLRRRFSTRAATLAADLFRLGTHALWIVVMSVYWALSNYGRSLFLPVAWLVVTLPLFVAAYDGSLADHRREAAQKAMAFVETAGASFATPSEAQRMEEWRKTRRLYLDATRQLAISNMIPFVGPLSIDGEVKKFLLCGVPPADESGMSSCAPVAPLGFQLTLIGQNVLSALLFFFFGLAMRNYFKVS